MMIRAALAAATVLGLAGCGSAQAPTPTSTAGTGATSSATPGTARDTVIDITIAGGAVDPVNAEFSATVGAPITLRVSSDAADELHVHSVPEHSFDVAARPDQVFTFTVEVPGRVEVELHHLDRTVATIQVRP